MYSERNMTHTVCTPNSDLANVPISEQIGIEVDPSFGAWADMEMSTDEICAEIRNSRTFRNRDEFVL